jgi:pyruvate kinase
MLVAKHRPRQLILAPTPLESTYRRLSLVWGVVPILSGAAKDTDEMITKALDESLRSGLVQHGQRVVITSGVPMGVPGSTNLIKVHAL